ncbi:hypothetical protein [Rickettsia canadensis]|nr:hypothetical protein [Rickettsia canadensis]WQM43416.1 hypothetical protein [Rickettsia canadensis]
MNKTCNIPPQIIFKVLMKLYITCSSIQKCSKSNKNIYINTDKAKTVKITKEDLEKSFKLHEEKLIILAQKLSSQEPINNDNYNPQTEYYRLIGDDGISQYIPTTEL